ncbi:hypothetical protein Q7P36_005436 [Cladosporium allicinum]
MPVGKNGTQEEQESNSWSNGEVYRSKAETNARPIIMHRGIPQWGPNSEVHTDLQLTMDMPERYTYRSATILDWTCDTEYRYTPLLSMRHSLTVGRELLRVFSKASFRSLEACGQQQWGIDPRTDDAGGGGEALV